MKLAIFGATGRTGQLLVEQALAQGHAVTALARDPNRLARYGDRLRVVAGDVRDAARVAEVVAGADAVLSVLGPMPKSTGFPVSQGLDHILAAMRRHSVRRLVLSTGAGVRDPQDQITPVHAIFGVLVRLLSPNAVKEMEAVVAKVRASDRDWTIVRVPRLVDGPATGHVWTGYVGNEMKTSLTRADLAAFMLEEAAAATHLRQAPAISN